MSNSRSRASALWGITTFFNPGVDPRRSANWGLFRESCARQGLPLVAVELAFDDEPFHLRDQIDAEIILRRRSNAVLWQKERLLNLALSALPETCTGVCWLDADVLFEDGDWVAVCADLLRRHTVIQPFAAAIRLPEHGRVEDFPGTRLGRGIPPGNDDATYSPSLCSQLGRWPARFAGTPGYAWCARRGLLDAVGFYDRCVVGGGDREFALALAFAPGKIPDRHLRIRHPRLREHLRAWHARVYAGVDGRIGFAPGVIHHLWHGSSASRGYEDRHAVLVEHDFDPERDLALDEGGCWRWSPGREPLAAAVAGYFAARARAG